MPMEQIRFLPCGECAMTVAFSQKISEKALLFAKKIRSALEREGIAIQPPELSSILSGANTYPKAERVLTVCDEILKGIEEKHNE